MSNQKTQGLYHKFNVSRADGRDAPGGDREGAEYFVLDLTHDPHARAALLAYAVSCRGEYPALSRDLLAKCEGMPETGRARDEYTDDPEREWQEFWRDIVAPDGVVDVEQVKKELCDFSMLMYHAAIVYEHATGGMISKPNTLPRVVCGVIDDHVTELCEEARQEEAEERDDLDGDEEYRDLHEQIMARSDRIAAGGQPPRQQPAASAEPAASAKPSGYAYYYPGWGIRFNDGREVNGCKPTETLPYWLGAAPVAQEPVAYRVMRKSLDGEWKSDGRDWCDGRPSANLVADIAKRSDGWRIEYAYATAPAAALADTRSDIQNLEASRDGYRDDARALHDALTRMVAMYEAEFDHEDTYLWRPDWLKSALARRNALDGNHDNQD